MCTKVYALMLMLFAVVSIIFLKTLHEFLKFRTMVGYIFLDGRIIYVQYLLCGTVHLKTKYTYKEESYEFFHGSIF